MNKFERTRYPRQFDLNSEDNILVTCTKDVKQDWFDLYKEFSVRTFYPKDMIKKTIHIPIIDANSLLNKKNGIIWQLLNNGLYVIPAAPVNPKDCIFRGGALKTDNKIIAEIALGSGTVRTVTHRGYIDVIATSIITRQAKKVIITKEINTENMVLAKQLEDCLLKFHLANIDNVIFEFSYYSKKVGYKKEQFICWEITSMGNKPIINDIYYDARLWDRYKENTQW